MEIVCMIDDQVLIASVPEMPLVDAIRHPLFRKSAEFREAVVAHRRAKVAQVLAEFSSDDIGAELLSVTGVEDLVDLVNWGMPVDGIFTADDGCLFMCPLSVACFFDDDCVEFLLSLGATMTRFPLDEAVEETPIPFSFIGSRDAAMARARRFMAVHPPPAASSMVSFSVEGDAL